MTHSLLTAPRRCATVTAAAIALYGCGGSDDSSPLGPAPPANSAAYRDVSATQLPAATRGRMCMDAAHADVDADGDTDLVLAIEFGLNVLLLNDGNGTFSNDPSAITSGDGDNEDLLLIDFNADGAPDLFSAHEDDGVHSFALNNGSGVFVDASMNLPLQSIANAAASLDVNGDGRPDILLGNRGANATLVQAANGQFVNETATRPFGQNTTQDLALADVDGDGDLDLFVVNETANRLFINDGTGRFSDATVANLPAAANNRESRQVDFADVDNDGDQDVVIANVAFNGTGNALNQVWLNDGNGRFSDASGTALAGVTNLGSSFTIHFVDIDRDGDPDIVSPTTQVGSGGTLSVWINDGNGVFTDAPESPFDPAVNGSVFDVEAFDANADGLTDLYFCHRTGADQLYIAN